MTIWQSFAGQVQVELVSADLTAATQQIALAGISMYSVTPASQLTLRFTIARRQLHLLEGLVKKRGEKLVVCHRLGLYWPLRSASGRPGLVIGLGILLFLYGFLPSRVLFFRVEGNHQVPTNQILSVAQENGLHFGSSRRDLRSEKIKNALLSAIPELKWAGVNTQGCVAVITVSENPKPILQEPVHSGICHIVAARDGVITELVCQRGTALCAPGQAVTRGQVLISGYTDCGIAVKAQAASGEVTAMTNRFLTAVTPDRVTQKVYSGKLIRRYSILLGKKRINLWFGSGIWSMECDRIEERYPWKLPGGFCLPVVFIVEKMQPVQLICQPLQEQQAATQLDDCAQQYLQSHMLAGRIETIQENISQQSGIYTQQGKYTCREIISLVHWEQTGVTHE